MGFSIGNIAKAIFCPPLAIADAISDGKGPELAKSAGKALAPLPFFVGEKVADAVGGGDDKPAPKGHYPPGTQGGGGGTHHVS